MYKVILFAGTTEGRDMACFLSANEVSTLVCAATEYGKQVLEDDEDLNGKYITVSSGRLDEAAMETLFTAEKPEYVVDATHPYAATATKNIKAACEKTGINYLRYARDMEAADEGDDMVFVDSVDSAAAWLAGTEGKILATTGSKELHKYTAIPGYQERVVARVLSTAEVAAECKKLGFEGKNLLMMQGPFSKELNVALLKQTDAKYMVTKVTGKSGGYMDKVEAARECGCTLVVIGEPMNKEDDGKDLSFAECKAELCKGLDLKTKQTAKLVGIGMGNIDSLTGEAAKAIEEAELIIGAGRMLESFRDSGKAILQEYNSDKIAAFISEHPEYEKIAVLLSGDTGFYSGAKKLSLKLAEAGARVSQIAGISSVAYFMSKVGISWDDAVIVSNHGLKTSLIPLIRDNHKVFSILGKKDDISNLANKLEYYGLDHVKIYVGERLSYEDEVIKSGEAGDFVRYENDPLCVVCVVNEKASETRINKLTERKDEEFLRDKVPMTKADIRILSVSKMEIEEDDICYDIGAGTGSVSIEMAIKASRGHVYAVEKKKEAVNLLEENKKKFMADNLTVIDGFAPEAMEELPPADVVFIGGSSGNMDEIIGAALSKNPNARFCINCIALESVGTALECAKKYAGEDFDLVQISASRGRRLGSYTMMTGENPIVIITFKGRG